jgi:tetratricopeptide (TPR) repeat protein
MPQNHFLRRVWTNSFMDALICGHPQNSGLELQHPARCIEGWNSSGCHSATARWKIENQGEKIIDFLGARRRLISEHGTAARGARSLLLEPLKKIVNAPDVRALFEKFILNPDQYHDLIHNIIEHHGIQGTPTEIYRALAHIGVDKLARTAIDTYVPESWEKSAELVGAGARLAISAGDWMTAENLWLKLDELAARDGAQNPDLQKQVMFELAGLLAARGEFEGAIEFYFLCEKLATESRDSKSLAQIRTSLGKAYLAHDAHEEALDFFLKAAEWAAAENDSRVLAAAELGAGGSLAGLGRLEESIPRLERAAAAAAGTGDPQTRVESARKLAEVLTKLGRHKEAIGLTVATLEIPELADNISACALLLYGLFETCCECGAWSDFLIQLTSLQNAIHRTEQFQHLGPVLILSAKAHTERGLFHLALHNLEEAAYLFQALEENDQLEKVRAAIEQIRELIQRRRNE